MTHISYRLYILVLTVLTVNDTITVALSGSDAIKESYVILGAEGTE